MNNEPAVRNLIRGSIQRAIQESVAALIVFIAFGAILSRTEAGSPRFFGCLLILAGGGFIMGVVWSHVLSYRLLQYHPADDAGFWREAFHAQARLLRMVPYWYCGPLGVGALLFSAPTSAWEIVPFLMVAGIFVVILAVVIWLNRRAAACIEYAATLLSK